MKTKRKILIIDDEPDILEFLSYNFRKQGYEVRIANDGTEGIQKALEVLPEIIISDILMPNMDGIEMCKQIRKIPEFKSTPFIFLTAVNDDYKVLYAMTSGADQYASKPIRFEYLFKMVNDMLEKCHHEFA
jgi:two-component system, OmpR family, alkaline phosphatase synthesis response regulator PhoP